MDLRPDSSDSVLEVPVRGRPKSKDFDRGAGRLMRQDLVDNERLGVNRIPFDDVSDGARSRYCHSTSPLQCRNVSDAVSR